MEEGLLKPRNFLLLLVVLGTALLLLAPTPASANRPHGQRPRPRRRNGQCQALPGFRVNGVEPLALARGHVTLVALLTSTCPFCIRQSEMLEELNTGLDNNGTHVHMMIVNGGPRPGPDEVGVFEEKVSFAVYHDDNDGTIWRRVFRGSKDDIFILTRCGQLAYRIPFPYSYLGYTYVRRAIHRAETGSVCPDCQAQPAQSNLLDRMMGDAPMPSFSRSRGRSGRFGSGRFGPNPRGHSRLFHRRSGNSRGGRGRNRNRVMNRSRCPGDDMVCRQMRRSRRRFDQYRNQHGIRLHSGMREEEVLGIFERSQSRGRMSPRSPVL